MMRDKTTGWCRLALAAGFAAVFITEVTWLARRPGFSIWNYLSYFTIQSNLIGAFAFALTGLALVRGTGVRHDRLRGAATVYLSTTGVVYLTMLADVQLHDVVPQLSNTYFHKVVPVAILLDWLLDPPRTRTFDRRVLVWLAYPLAYLAYSLVRGPLTGGWYPYPFIDPANGGYGHVAIGATTVALIVLAAALLLSWTGDLLGRRRGVLLPADATAESARASAAP